MKEVAVCLYVDGNDLVEKEKIDDVEEGVVEVMHLRRRKA